MVKSIQKVIVQYEDGQTEEFIGKGIIRRTHTSVKVEPTPGKVEEVSVSYITIGMPLNA